MALSQHMQELWNLLIISSHTATSGRRKSLGIWDAFAKHRKFIVICVEESNLYLTATTKNPLLYQRMVFIMSIMELGCCGAYCKTCRALSEKTCKGCKLGYDNGIRDINKAKCKIKVCCIQKENHSCADCQEYNDCPIVNEFYHKNGVKYKKYQQALDFILANGYDSFFETADEWKNAYGKYKNY